MPRLSESQGGESIQKSFQLPPPRRTFAGPESWSQVYAVLEPFSRKGGFKHGPFPPLHHADGILRELFALRNAQLLALRDLGWQKALPGLRSWCLPGMVYYPGIQSEDTRIKLRSCRLSTWCPFCWAREVVRNVYDKLSSALFVEQRRPLPFGVLELIRYQHLSRQKVRAGQLIKAVQRNRKVLFEALPGTLGAIQLSTIEPSGDDWLLKLRVLALLPEDFDVGSLPEPRPDLTLEHHAPPVRKKELPRIVGRVCEYPKGLLTGDPRLVVQILEARSGARLLESYGRMRGSM